MDFFLRPWLLSKFRHLLSKRAVGLLKEGDQPVVKTPPYLSMLYIFLRIINGFFSQAIVIKYGSF